MEQGPHQSFADVIACIVIFSGEVLLADMIEDIINPGRHLIMRQRQRVLRIQDRKPGHDLLICKDMADLHLCLVVCDNRSCIHL